FVAKTDDINIPRSQLIYGASLKVRRTMLHLAAARDAASQAPLYEQRCRSIAREISAGALPAGARMPGRRSLAEALSVSVNTVDGAYQMLVAEGYLASRPRSGFYVQEYPARPAAPGQ